MRLESTPASVWSVRPWTPIEQYSNPSSIWGTWSLIKLPPLTIELSGDRHTVRLGCDPQALVGCLVWVGRDRKQLGAFLRRSPGLFVFCATCFYLDTARPPRRFKTLLQWAEERLLENLREIEAVDDTAAGVSRIRARESDFALRTADSNRRLRKAVRTTLLADSSLTRTAAMRWAKRVIGKRMSFRRCELFPGPGQHEIGPLEVRELLVFRKFFDAKIGWFNRELTRQKLASMKQLAYGASHEINNPLANISTRAQTMLREEQDPVKRHKLAVIYEQAMRAHEMISDLMLFANPPASQPRETDLRLLIAKIRRELGPELATDSATMSVNNERIPFRVIFGPDVDRISVDPDHLGIAIKAIVRNSIESCRGTDRPSEISLHVYASKNERIGFEISDNGRGIAKEIEEHLFDPFFSGREAGRGLGFGLSKAWRIAEMHGGDLRLVESSNRGVTFLLTLPKQSQAVGLKTPMRLDPRFPAGYQVLYKMDARRNGPNFKGRFRC